MSLKPVRGLQINKSHPLARDIAGCWLFNEGCGSQVTDLSGYKHNIPVVGGTPDWMAGKNGASMYFNDVDYEYLELDVAPISSMPCTMLIWLCPYNITQGNYYYPLYIADSRVKDQSWSVLLNYGSNGEAAFVTNIYLTGRAASTKSLTAGKWHQIVCVAAGTTDRRCYVDGGNKGTNAIAANVPSGLNRISIGRAGDSTPGYYFPGKVGSVFLWNRVLTDSEIAWLYREPYAMFDSDNMGKSLSFSISHISLSGTINAQSSVEGCLSTSNKTNMLEREWLLDVLSNSITANAFKLSTVLSMSWFWMRPGGCNALYRGSNLEHMDFDNILKTVESDAENISVPEFCEHENDNTYYYLLRRLNTLGVSDKTVNAAVKVVLNSEGDLEANRTNSIFTSAAKVVDSDKIQLEWFYCPLSQEVIPAYFNIYCDVQTGQIDYENPIAAIEYAGHRLYRFESQPLGEGTYRFVIRATDISGVGNISLKQIKVQITNTSPSSIEIIDVENI